MPTPTAYKIVDHSYVVVVSADGSGLRATMAARTRNFDFGPG